MFRALICPPSGVCDYVVELPHGRLKHNSVLLQLAARITPSVNCNPQSNTIQELYSQCGISTIEPQTPEGGHINAQNMLSIKEVK